ncbi:sigma-70 family RNA polymerase sigma factor (plasmid) [Tistrella bauzanensis]|nr:sigma-70 family RNA polymerase sigma factor [Tistrella bauzanensis]
MEQHQPPRHDEPTLHDEPALHDEIVNLIPSLRAFARSLTRSACEADDLVQETLMKAIANARQFTAGTNLRAWLFTIQRNTFYTLYHKQQREPVLVVEDLPGVHVKPSQEWSLKLRLVDEAVQKLPPDQREALMLVGGGGMSYEEAAEICGCALGTIKSRVSRARTALLRLLDSDDEHDFLDDVVGGSRRRQDRLTTREQRQSTRPGIADS